MTRPVKGWAVVIDENILVPTVSATRRAAIVNYLAVERRLIVTSAWTDEDIELAWDKAKSMTPFGHEPPAAVEVEIREA